MRGRGGGRAKDQGQDGKSLEKHGLEETGKGNGNTGNLLPTGFLFSLQSFSFVVVRSPSPALQVRDFHTCRSRCFHACLLRPCLWKSELLR